MRWKSEWISQTWKTSFKSSNIMRGRVCSLILFSTLGKINFSASGQIDISSDMKSLGTVTVYDGPPLSGGDRNSILCVFGAVSCSSSSWTTTVVSFFVDVDADAVLTDVFLSLSSVCAAFPLTLDYPCSLWSVIGKNLSRTLSRYNHGNIDRAESNKWRKVKLIGSHRWATVLVGEQDSSKSHVIFWWLFLAQSFGFFAMRQQFRV